MFVALLSSGEYIQLEEGESDVSIWQVPDDFAFDQGGEVERIARDGQDVFSVFLEAGGAWPAGRGQGSNATRRLPTARCAQERRSKCPKDSVDTATSPSPATPQWDTRATWNGIAVMRSTAI